MNFQVAKAFLLGKALGVGCCSYACPPGDSPQPCLKTGLNACLFISLMAISPRLSIRDIEQLSFFHPRLNPSVTCLLLQALADFCGSYGLVCSEPTVWVLHYLSTSGTSCESKIIGVYATRADGKDALERQLGGRMRSKSIFRRWGQPAGRREEIQAQPLSRVYMAGLQVARHVETEE